MAGPNVTLMKMTASAKLGPKASDGLKKYVGKACQAVSGGIGVWQPLAMFSGLRINGPVAIGTPGCLKGPSLETFVFSLCPLSTDWELKMSRAVAGGVSSAFAKFQRSVTVPGMPWYPAFAAYPGPMAPPMPNIPCPLAALPHSAPRQNSVRSAILRKAGALAGAEAVAGAVAAAFAAAFGIWLAGVMVKNVMGKGPVPSFAPPFVPVGPVVGGDNIAVPGHLAV